MASQYWVRGPLGVKGPYDSLQVRGLAAVGQLTPTMEISTDGNRWILAENMRGLFPRPVEPVDDSNTPSVPRGMPPPLPPKVAVHQSAQDNVSPGVAPPPLPSSDKTASKNVWAVAGVAGAVLVGGIVVAALVSRLRPSNSRFQPFLNHDGYISQTNCHMGTCSWIKWLAVTKSHESPAEVQLELLIIDGSSNHLGDYPTSADGVAIEWNARPSAATILCSVDRPTVAFNSDPEILPLADGDGFSGPWISATTTYFQACHSAVVTDELIEKLGYLHKQ
jgi:hypothetical protein